MQVRLRSWCMLHPMSVSDPAATIPRSPDRGRVASLAPIVVFDTAGPLVLYNVLKGNGFSDVSALVLSGILPSAGVLLAALRDRRLDAVGIVVLAGIVVGTVLGAATDNARLVLLEGSIPTAMFAVACLGSLATRRPLMFRFAHEFLGTETPKGRDFADRWRYPGFRHVFRLITIVWGVAYLAEAAARIVIVESTSTGNALTISKVMPIVVAGVLVAWMSAYGRRSRRKGEALGAAAAERGEAPPPMPD